MKTRSSYQRGWMERRKRNGKNMYMIRWHVRDASAPSGWRKRSEILKKCNSSKDARRQLDERMRTINEENPEPVGSDTLTFQDLVNGPWKDYLDKQEVKPSTLASYRSMLEIHLFPKFGSTPLDEIRSQHLTRFFSRLRRKGCSPKYATNIYGVLKTIFDVAVEHELIPGSPLRPKLHRPNRRGSKKKPTIDVREIQRLFEHISEDWKALVKCVALTGLRLGEALGLRWCDVDFLHQTLTVSNSLWRGQLVCPKTEDSARKLHIVDILLTILLVHKQQSAFTLRDDFVFCRLDGSPCDPDHLRKEVLYPAMDRAGIKRLPRSHGFHLFRHTAASIVHKETGSVKLAQRQLGHSNMSTTADVYIHPDDEEARKAAEVLARAICPPYCPPGASEGDHVQ